MRNKKIIYRLIVLIGILVLPIIVSKPVGAMVDFNNDSVIYSNYVQTQGYLPWVSDGEIAGLTGKSLRMEAWMLKLGTKMTEGDMAGSSIKYRSYVEGSGWQDWKVNGTQSGELNKRVETINISLDGPIAANYDVYYSVHVQNIGWMGWAKNGENAGTSGYDYRIEAMKVVLVTKGAAAPGITTGAYVDLSKVDVVYKSSVQSYGYQPWKMDGEISGITGKSLRLEAWMLKLGTKMTEGDMAGSNIKYRSYVEGSGWQDWKVNGIQSGELNKRVETINISLDGPIAANYDVYYSVHVQNIGWMGWAKNGENAGTSGYDYRIEAMKVVLVTKGAAAPGITTGAYKNINDLGVTYRSSVQFYGYQPWKIDGEISGITGKSLRLEAWMLKLGTKMTEGDMAGSNIKYRSYVEGSGWQDWKVNGTQSGELNKRVERINIGLEGAIAAKYDVYYSVHVQNIGWMGWAKNGANAGTSGYDYRIEAMKVVLVTKGAAAPGSTIGSYRDKTNDAVSYRSSVQSYGYQPWKMDGEISGITGKSLRLEAWMLKLGTKMTEGDMAGSNIKYRSYVEGSRWQDWKVNGIQSGELNKRVETINISLDGPIAANYDVYYSVHVQNIGWMGWAKNGENAGTSGYDYRIEAMKVVLVTKGAAAPGDTVGAFKQLLLASMAGDTVYMQVQNGGGFLYSDGGILKLGRYNLIGNKDYYKWKEIEYPTDSGKYVIQNLGDNKVLGSDLKLKEFALSDDQYWSITENPTGNLYGTYNVKSIKENKNIDGILNSSNIGLLSLATADTSVDQKINMINLSDLSAYEISGISTVSKTSIKDYLISKIGSTYFNSTSPIYLGSSITINQYYNQVLDAYYNIAPKYGVKPEVAIAQAFHETGYMKFGGIVKIDDFNFAGIYATGSLITEAEAANLRGADPNKVELIAGDDAARFKSIEYGVEAQIQHLIAYATDITTVDTNNDGVLEINGKTLADPRFNLIPSYKRNSGNILPALNSNWAVPGYTYGQSIMNIVKDMKKFVLPAIKIVVDDGIYSVNSTYSGLSLDVNSSSLINNVGLKQQTPDNGNNQYWNIEMVSAGIYRIISVRSGKALSFKNNQVVQDTWAGTNEQLWYFVDNGNGGVKICSKINDYSLALALDSKTVGVDIILNQNANNTLSDFNLVLSIYNKSDLVSETKAIKGVMDGIYNIRNVTSNQLVNMPTQGEFSYVSPNPRNFIQLNQWSENSTIAQKFKIIRMSTGDFKIVGVNSGKLLTVNDGTENGAVFQLYDKYNDIKQLWSILSNGDSYVLRNSSSGKNIIVANTGNQGSELLQSSNSQNWRLTKLTDIPNFVEKIKGLAGKVIWIDPGHGSSFSGYFDPGAVRTGIREVDSNTWYSLELAEKLRAGGATVILTRTSADSGLNIDNRQRTYLASEANADIYISVHSNASTNTSVSGAETYYYLPSSIDDPYYAATKDYDQRIVKSIALANNVNPKMAAGGGFVNRGVRGANFAVIRETAMPAILLEVGFISHSGDLAKIKDATNRTNTVNGIYQGIVEYFNNQY